MQSQIIRQAHENGHFSVDKTEKLIKKNYWFVGMREKIEKVLRNCLDCILAERKQGNQEGLLKPIPKGEIPLDMYHVDHVGPLHSTRKSYRHIFVVVDAFSKFTWLYATKTTNSFEVIDRLKKQSMIFGNPRAIISDRGSAFTSNDFRDCCNEERIKHILATTGMPRGNGQVERMNRTLIPLLTKLSAPKPDNWYKFIDIAQRFLNTTPHRSIGTSPFHLPFGIHMRLKDNLDIRKLIEDGWINIFREGRDELRECARDNIQKIQTESKKNFDKRRIEARRYKEGDLVAIKRTQTGPGMKFASKFLGPYVVIRLKRNDRYVVSKVGEHEGPRETSIAAEYMKPWVSDETGMFTDEDNDADLT